MAFLFGLRPESRSLSQEAVPCLPLGEEGLTFHVQSEGLFEGLLGKGLTEGLAGEGQTVVLPSYQQRQVGHGDVATVKALAGESFKTRD